jgi:hypothetical protein
MDRWALQARELRHASLEKLARDRHSNLIGPSISYKENEAL